MPLLFIYQGIFVQIPQCVLENQCLLRTASSRVKRSLSILHLSLAAAVTAQIFRHYFSTYLYGLNRDTCCVQFGRG